MSKRMAIIGIISTAFLVLFEPECSPIPASASPARISSRTNSRKQGDEATAAKSGYLTVNGIRVHYLEWGTSGPALVLLHGLYDDADVWKPFAPHLLPDHHIIAPDRRGAGGSDTPKEGYDPATLSSDVTSLIQQKKLGPVTLIGHSAGAEIALRMAATNPKLIRSLIMIDGGFWPKHDMGRASPPVPCTKDPRECALLALENSSRQYDPDTLYDRVSSPALLVIARQASPSGDLLAEYKKQGIDFFDQMRKAEEHAKEVADKKFPHGRLVVIENTSHWIQKDQPLALAQTIRTFLSNVR